MVEAAGPLVSILVPAYTPDFLPDALASATNQTYRNVEIVVVNDHPGSPIERIVTKEAGERARYHAHPRNLGSVATYGHCLELARGKYIKYLNDDDLLAPDCVRRMVGEFERLGRSVTLVTSKRRRIDPAGATLPERTPTMALFRDDAYVAGFDLATFMVRTLTNFVGEPTTAMFRREDLERSEPGLFVLNGRAHGMNVDVVLWLKLLLLGDAVYLAEELSSLREHAGQEQRAPKNTLAMTLAWDSIVEDARAVGLLDDSTAHEEARSRCLRLFERTLVRGDLAPAEYRQLAEQRDERLAEIAGGSEGRPGGPVVGRLPRVRRTVRRVRRRPGWRPPLRHRYLRPAPRGWLGRLFGRDA